MSFGKDKSKQQTNEIQTAELDPLAREALTDVLGKSRDLFNSNAPIFAPVDPATVSGLQTLQDRPLSPFIGEAGGQLTGTLGGDFLNLFQPGLQAGQQQLQDTLSGDVGSRLLNFDNRALAGVEDRIINTVNRGVGDQFTGAGRTVTSPAAERARALGISEGIAPFLFGSLENQRGLVDAERSRQIQAAQLAQGGFLGSRGNQLGALGFVPGIDAAFDTQANRQLAVGDIIQAENQNIFDTPFTRVERFANPVIAAAGGFPVTLTREGQARGSSTNFGFNLF